MIAILFATTLLRSQDSTGSIPYNPMAAYFRTSESAYAVLPPRDLGIDNVTHAQVSGADIVVAVSKHSGALQDLQTDSNDFDVRLIWIDANTGRKVNLEIAEKIPAVWGLAVSNPCYLGLKCVGNTNYFLAFNKRDGRQILLPEGVVGLGASTNRIAIANDESIIVFDGSGNEISRLPHLPGDPLPVKGGLLFFEESGLTYFEVDRLSVTPVDRQRVNELMAPDVVVPYTVQFSPEFGGEDPSAGAPVRIVPRDEKMVSPATEGQTESEPRLPHELIRRIEVAGRVHMAELVGNHLYLVQSRRLFVREIVPVPLDVYRSVIVSRIKTEAMMAAKQVATALHIYAADNDDRFPGPDWRETLEPYLKNTDLIGRFTYAGNGEKMDQFENPASTAIGWTDTPYGRAIAYVDGSVRWKPKP